MHLYYCQFGRGVFLDQSQLFLGEYLLLFSGEYLRKQLKASVMFIKGYNSIRTYFPKKVSNCSVGPALYLQKILLFHKHGIESRTHNLIFTPHTGTIWIPHEWLKLSFSVWKLKSLLWAFADVNPFVKIRM